MMRSDTYLNINREDDPNIADQGFLSGTKLTISVVIVYIVYKWIITPVATHIHSSSKRSQDFINDNEE